MTALATLRPLGTARAARISRRQYLIVAPDIFTSSAHTGDGSAMNFANCSGVPGCVIALNRQLHGRRWKRQEARLFRGWKERFRKIC
jgi:hypothetical protein